MKSTWTSNESIQLINHAKVKAFQQRIFEELFCSLVAVAKSQNINEIHKSYERNDSISVSYVFITFWSFDKALNFFLLNKFKAWKIKLKEKFENV